MARKVKRGDTIGVREWENLNSIGDGKRLLKWVILSLRNHTMDRADAATFGYLVNIFLRSCEGSQLEERLANLEKAYHYRQQNSFPGTGRVEPPRPGDSSDAGGNSVLPP